MFFTILTISILVYTLASRATRGERIKINPRKSERLSVWKIRGKSWHIHHSYVGVIILPFGYYGNVWAEIGLALIISDIIFHIIAHFYWGDPIWD